MTRTTMAMMALVLVMPVASLSAAEPRTFNPDAEHWYEPNLAAGEGKPLLDLRYLNEAYAGEHGRITMRDGKLYRGDGQPIRFVGNATGKHYPNALPTSEEIAKRLRNMAAMGYNMQRYRVRYMFSKATDDPTRPADGYLDNFHREVAEAKKDGIYTWVSAYFPVTGVIVEKSDVEGMKPGQKPFGLLFFDERSQEIYKAQMSLLLKSKNPYTGLPLAEDPSLGAIEIVDEGSLFFNTFDPRNIPPVQWRKLEGRFAAFLARKYGSLDKALATFGANKDDSTEDGVAGLMPAWALTREFFGNHEGEDVLNRCRAEARFLTEVQQGFYRDMIAWYRQDLGVRCPIICSNWRTADPGLTDALERYSYMEGDVLDIHRYFSCDKQGGPSYLVVQGQSFRNIPAIRDPLAMPMQFIQYAGKAGCISETNMAQPNYYRAEFIPMLFSYGALEGMDIIMPFNNQGQSPRATPWGSLDMSTPVSIGSMPAFALAYRQGYIGEAAPVVKQTLSLPQLYELKGTFADAQGRDDFRESAVQTAEQKAQDNSGFDPYAFYVGKVERSFTDADKSKLEQTDLQDYVNRTGRTVRSLTGELRWDWGKGVFTLASPRIQGAAGFLADAGPIALPDLEIRCTNHYAAIFVVSLDGEPLKTSRKMFVQVITGERPSSWKSSASGQDDRVRIDELKKSGDTWRVRRPEGVLKLKGGPFTATPLRLNGYADGGPMVCADGSIDLARDCCWYLLDRK